MRKQLSGSICLGGLLVIGLLLWQPQARAADEPKIINIVPGPNGPVFDEPAPHISAGQTIKWVPQVGKIPHHFFEGPPGEDRIQIELEFNRNALETSEHKFETSVVYHCKIHPKTMKGTITVK